MVETTYPTGLSPPSVYHGRIIMIIEIFVGVLSSIIATVLLYYLKAVGLFEDRRQIRDELERIHRCLYEVWQKMEYNNIDYERILKKTDEVIESIFKIDCMIKKLTYRLDKNRMKMIITLLYELRRLCEKSSNITIGYSGQEEIIARVEKIKKYFCNGSKDLYEHPKPLIMVELAIDLNQDKSLSDSLNQFVRFRDMTSLEKYNELRDDLFDANTFRYSNIICSLKDDQRERCFTKEEYLKYIEKEFNINH